MRRWAVEVLLDTGTGGSAWLTVRVPGEVGAGSPEGCGPVGREMSDPLVECDEEELADPGGCDF